MLPMIAPEAPINREPLVWVKKGALVAIFPTLVYFFFIFYGAQNAAYQRVRACVRCGGEHPADGCREPS